MAQSKTNSQQLEVDSKNLVIHYAGGNSQASEVANSEVKSQASAGLQTGAELQASSAQLEQTNHSRMVVDYSGNGLHAIMAGAGQLPEEKELYGRQAILFHGGGHGSGYLQLPRGILAAAGDTTGLTVVSWIYLLPGQSVWERIFDFGEGEQGPYLFLTRGLRGVCFNGTDIAVDFNKQLPAGEWIHVALVVSGTKGGTESNAGPKLYINGQLAVDGSISQTTSGTYLAYRQWLATLEGEAYSRNYIGRSQFTADADFKGAISDFRLYSAELSEQDIIGLMCQTLSDEQIIVLASRSELALPTSIVTEGLTLPTSVLGGLVEIEWVSSNIEALTNDGQLGVSLTQPQQVELTATLKRGAASQTLGTTVTVLPQHIIPYEIELLPEGKSVAVSPDMYGLFYEDINNAADGGIYAELVRNRSFEAFTFDSFSHVCGENGHSTGRRKQPLEGWYGELACLQVKTSGGLNEHFGIQDEEVNATYVTAPAGTTIINKGFNDSNHNCAMSFVAGEDYLFTIWAKGEPEVEGNDKIEARGASVAKAEGRGDGVASLRIVLQNAEGDPISEELHIELQADGQWHKYGSEVALRMTSQATTLGQLSITVQGGSVSMDMISLFPERVWGSTEEQGSTTATSNYRGNPNYRLRKDMVVALQQMAPKFLRFPGGCISEGSHVWDNVYDWKHSVGAVELRKENFNVWGYMMTLGLGYMEYFQLAEDLNATPLPVMACGVLCQARSDYANPAGGGLRDYYIKNFTDLIDFAISEDVEGNEWAALRASMGHPQPFDLRYLGVGNENWGTEFFANFEIFKAAIEHYMEEHYPGRELTIISTVGAQADDDAYQQGWKFISGHYEGSETIAFTDGCRSFEETITWYSEQANYMDTIVDEHYYRSNDYLLANGDRYNYYLRVYDAHGELDEKQTSKVFVGEYASNDKNTLAGAIAEAAIMTSFENNADVVRLAAYAPLFNKVLTDGSYRWTPDCIWFDDTDIWFTPNYYVQSMFAKHIGTRTVASQFHTYRGGEKTVMKPQGGISISTSNAHIIVKSVAIKDAVTGELLFQQDFANELHADWKWLGDGGGDNGKGSANVGSNGSTDVDINGSVNVGNGGSNGSDAGANVGTGTGARWHRGVGLVLESHDNKRTGLYLDNNWSQITVEVVAHHVRGEDGLYIGVGLQNAGSAQFDVIEYAIGAAGKATGIKVFKRGVEAYTLGDYASSTMAGNLRAAFDERLVENTDYFCEVIYGGTQGDELIFSHRRLDEQKQLFHGSYKLEAYNTDVFYSTTADEEQLYMKLVNADSFEKKVKVNTSGLALADEVQSIVLTGAADLLHVPNVNKKNAELIVPQTQKAMAQNGEIVVTLPPHSVQLLVWDRR